MRKKELQRKELLKIASNLANGKDVMSVTINVKFIDYSEMNIINYAPSPSEIESKISNPFDGLEKEIDLAKNKPKETIKKKKKRFRFGGGY